MHAVMLLLSRIGLRAKLRISRIVLVPLIILPPHLVAIMALLQMMVTRIRYVNRRMVTSLRSIIVAGSIVSLTLAFVPFLPHVGLTVLNLVNNKFFLLRPTHMSYLLFRRITCRK